MSSRRSYSRDRRRDHRSRSPDRHHRRRSRSRDTYQRRRSRSRDTYQNHSREYRRDRNERPVQSVSSSSSSYHRPQETRHQAPLPPPKHVENQEEGSIEEEEFDEEYRRRVEMELQQQETKEQEEQKEEETYEERKRRREQLLAQALQSKNITKSISEEKTHPSHPTPQSHPTMSQPTSSLHTQNTSQPAQPTSQPTQQASLSSSALPASKKPDDMFDMFADSPLDTTESLDASKVAAVDNALLDFDDPEGYYRYRPHDLLNDRFLVVGLQGQGVFSTVLRVKDEKAAEPMKSKDLVVKIIRNNETMFKAGMKEVEFLTLLNSQDIEDKRHIVRMYSHFMHRDHLCIVFEPLSMDLRKVVKKFGGVGLSLSAVRSYAKQMLIALRHLKKCGVLHGDIKPDNILANDSMTTLKLCDFGSAGKLTLECEITPYLVSRFYRAPEIMLGLPYDEKADLWSVGCVLYELYTGKILFSGKNNNEMLRLQQELRGRFSVKMLKKAQFRDKHFDEEGNFLLKKVDALTGTELRQKIRYTQPMKDVYAMIKEHAPSNINEQEKTKLRQLSDLIKQMLTLDPALRLSADELLKHSFFE